MLRRLGRHTSAILLLASLSITAVMVSKSSRVAASANRAQSGAFRAVLQATNPRAGSLGEDARVARNLREYVLELGEQNLSGALLVARDHKILFHGGFGYADTEYTLPVSSGTLFVIASVSKQFTAAAVLKLEMMRKLTTSDSIGMIFDKVPTDKKN